MRVLCLFFVNLVVVSMCNCKIVLVLFCLFFVLWECIGKRFVKMEVKFCFINDESERDMFCKS